MKTTAQMTSALSRIIEMVSKAADEAEGRAMQERSDAAFKANMTARAADFRTIGILLQSVADGTFELNREKAQIRGAEMKRFLADIKPPANPQPRQEHKPVRIPISIEQNFCDIQGCPRYAVGEHTRGKGVARFCGEHEGLVWAKLQVENSGGKPEGPPLRGDRE